MMKRTELVPGAGTTIDLACFEVEKALEISLTQHESLYYGGHYFRFDSEVHRVELRSNFVEDDGELTQPAFPEATLFVQLYGDASVVDAAAARIRARATHFAV